MAVRAVRPEISTCPDPGQQESAKFLLDRFLRARDGSAAIVVEIAC
jgi:hypothetical protein